MATFDCQRVDTTNYQPFKWLSGCLVFDDHQFRCPEKFIMNHDSRVCFFLQDYRSTVYYSIICWVWIPPILDLDVSTCFNHRLRNWFHQERAPAQCGA